jgi:hypothetical protein
VFEVVRQAHHERVVVEASWGLEHQVNPAHTSDDYPVRTEPVEGPEHPEFIEGPELVGLFAVVRQAHHERVTKYTNEPLLHERDTQCTNEPLLHEQVTQCTNGPQLHKQIAGASPGGGFRQWLVIE